ncbi:MFS transporter [Sphaerisporangium sp. TRM90804]|uniref:MFS transporter n=1 Tax=Sphaerisporangium sp. TRM90804 TaxID=3031113 RepID=UPI00244A1CF4|nr:MFS transporter [Sphaerisporangium sp. TRM90804]MDH2429502.1 MFS transporter [Sphaerisporangium sp. TRM90804]
MNARLPLRLVRASAFAVVCVTLAVLGHRVAGGAGPPEWATTAGVAGVALAAACMAGRERSPQTIIGSLAGAQVALHQLFDLSSGGGGSVLSLHPAHAEGLGAGIGMIVAHLTATLLTGWWLARGESALWSVLRRAGARAAVLLRRLLGVPGGGADGPRRPGALVFRCDTPLPARRELRHAVRRRGPPLPAAF